MDLDLSVCTSIHATLSRQSQRRFIGNRACGSSSRRLRRAFLPHHEIHQEENNKEGVSVVVVVGNGAVIVICTRARAPRGPLSDSLTAVHPSAVPLPNSPTPVHALTGQCSGHLAARARRNKGLMRPRFKTVRRPTLQFIPERTNERTEQGKIASLSSFFFNAQRDREIAESTFGWRGRRGQCARGGRQVRTSFPGLWNRRSVQGSAERWSPGCVKAAGKARQEWQAGAVTKFTKPGDRLLAARPPLIDAAFLFSRCDD